MRQICAFTFMLVLIAQANLYAMSADEFTTLLVTHTWTGLRLPMNPYPKMGVWGGVLELEFAITDGKLTGKITKVTGQRLPVGGSPLSEIKINVEGAKPAISFKSRAGTTFYLTLEKNGNLVGEAWTLANDKNSVTLAPSAK